MVIIFTVFGQACKKESVSTTTQGSVPVIITDSVRYDHFASAGCYGTIKDTGSGYVKDFGFCIGKSHNPVVNGTGSSTILSPYLNYHQFTGIAANQNS